MKSGMKKRARRKNVGKGNKDVRKKKDDDGINIENSNQIKTK